MAIQCNDVTQLLHLPSLIKLQATTAIYTKDSYTRFGQTSRSAWRALKLRYPPRHCVQAQLEITQSHQSLYLMAPASLDSEQASPDPVLHIIGLGLGDESDITLRGLRLVRSAAAVFLEAYTSILSVSHQSLEELYERPITVADREFVEERAEDILDAAFRPGGAAFLVVGDPFGATTHSDLWLRARAQGIHVNVVHNASIINAVAVTGLQLYRFGQAISLCFWTETDRPTSYYPKLVENRKADLHTLCLLDIKVKEPSLESLARGKKVYEPPKYMTVSQAAEQLLTIDRELGIGELTGSSMAVGVARIGQTDQKIVYASMDQLVRLDFGVPLHSLIIPARDLHFHELDVLECFKAP